MAKEAAMGMVRATGTAMVMAVMPTATPPLRRDPTLGIPGIPPTPGVSPTTTPTAIAITVAEAGIRDTATAVADPTVQPGISPGQ